MIDYLSCCIADETALHNIPAGILEEFGQALARRDHHVHSGIAHSSS